MVYELKKFARRVAFGGNKYYCPLCGARLRKFNDVLDEPASVPPYRHNAECPVCLTRERGRLLWLFFERETDMFTKPVKLLHVAPELQFSQRFSEFKNIDYTGIDKFEEGYNGYSSSTRYGDITDLNEFAGNTFDYVLCSHVLEHVPEDLKALAELKRVIKPGGHVFILVPLDKKSAKTREDDPSIVTAEQRAYHYGQHDHVRYYGLDFPERLAKAGFNVHTIDYIAKLSPAEVQRFALVPEFIYDCTK